MGITRKAQFVASSYKIVVVSKGEVTGFGSVDPQQIAELAQIVGCRQLGSVGIGYDKFILMQ